MKVPRRRSVSSQPPRADPLAVFPRNERVPLVGWAGGVVVAAGCARLLAGCCMASPSDVTAFVLAIGLVLVVSMLASLVPAVRAACVDPMQVLQDE